VPGKVKTFHFSIWSRPAVGIHSTSYPMGTGLFFSGIKRQESEADHSHPIYDEIKRNWDLYIHSPIRLHGIVLS
jgi:hypothetical protein